MCVCVCVCMHVCICINAISMYTLGMYVGTHT